MIRFFRVVLLQAILINEVSFYLTDILWSYTSPSNKLGARPRTPSRQLGSLQLQIELLTRADERYPGIKVTDLARAMALPTRADPNHTPQH